MKINEIINHELIRLNEELNNNNIYAYHSTSCDNINNIEKEGLKIGNRSMQGKGLYSFYHLDDAHGYGIRNAGLDSCIVKFKINPYKSLIYSKTIAEEILGKENADIIKQFDKLFDGFDNFLNQYVYKYSYTTEFLMGKYGDENGLIQHMRNLFNSNDEMNQRTIMWNMFSSDFDDNATSTIFDGEYGLTVLVKNLNMIQLISHYKLINGRLSQELPFTGKLQKIKDAINANPEFQPLQHYNFSSIDDVYLLKNRMDNKQYQSRNNREYEEIDNIINLLEKLIKIYKSPL